MRKSPDVVTAPLETTHFTRYRIRRRIIYYLHIGCGLSVFGCVLASMILPLRLQDTFGGFATWLDSRPHTGSSSTLGLLIVIWGIGLILHTIHFIRAEARARQSERARRDAASVV